MSKAIITTCVNNYRPDLCQYTLPNLKAYAAKIGADFHVISERKYKDWYASYEKLQAYEIAKNYDATLLVDADLILAPNLPDLTDAMNPNECGYWMRYNIKLEGQFDLWDWTDEKLFGTSFIRDGRNLGIVGSLVGCTRYTAEIFKPLSEFSPAIQNFLYRGAIVDEFAMSYNVANYGLKTAVLWQSTNGIYHCDATTVGKGNDVEELKKVLTSWGCL